MSARAKNKKGGSSTQSNARGSAPTKKRGRIPKIIISLLLVLAMMVPAGIWLGSCSGCSLF